MTGPLTGPPGSSPYAAATARPGAVPAAPAAPAATADGGSARPGPLVLVALAAGGLGTILALAALLMPVAYVGKTEAKAISTFTFLDYGTGFVVAVLLSVVLLATAAVTRGRYHLAARVTGAVTALFALVDVIAQSPRADLYATNVSVDMHEAVTAHLGGGFFVGVAAAVLLGAGCALVHHGRAGGPRRAVPHQHAQQPHSQAAWPTQPPQPPQPPQAPQSYQPPPSYQQPVPQGQPQQGFPPQQAYPSQSGPQPPHAERG